MASIVAEDPCRVLLRKVRLNPDHPKGLSWHKADAYRAVWWPEDDDDNAFLLKWLRENAPDFTTETEFPTPDDSDDAVPMHAFIRFPDPSLATRFVDWLTARQKAWAARHDLVTAATDAYCMQCGGPIATKRTMTKVNRIADIEIAFTAPQFWCGHCESWEHTVCRKNDSWDKYSTIVRVVRAHLGLGKGQRAGKTEGEPRVRMETDMQTDDKTILDALSSNG